MGNYGYPCYICRPVCCRPVWCCRPLCCRGRYYGYGTGAGYGLGFGGGGFAAGATLGLLFGFI